MERKKIILGIALAGLAFSGCATDGTGGGLSEREGGALLGAGLGAGTGAIIGNQTGHAGAGTAIGAARRGDTLGNNPATPPRPATTITFGGSSVGGP